MLNNYLFTLLEYIQQKDYNAITIKIILCQISLS